MSIKIGQFTIIPLKPGYIEDADYWIYHESGEGMGVSKEKLITLLEEFWEKEF